MPAQPPPDAPAPPPSEAALRSHRWWRWIWVVGVSSVIGLLVGLGAPLVIRSPRNASLTEAVSNAKQIGLALFEFEGEYGKYPDDTTIAAVQSRTGSRLPLGTKTSNDFFRQLIASNLASEPMFYAKVEGCTRGNGLGAKADLAKNECGFSYIAGLTSTGNSSRPLAVTPLIPGTTRFDPKPFNGRAMILRMDNSVTMMTIHKNGHVMAHGVNLLDPANPIWGNEKFTIVWPDH